MMTAKADIILVTQDTYNDRYSWSPLSPRAAAPSGTQDTRTPGSSPTAATEDCTRMTVKRRLSFDSSKVCRISKFRLF